MRSRPAEEHEREWLSWISQLPCIVCSHFLNQDTPAEIHHIEGKTVTDAHCQTIPLCHRHHRHKDNAPRRRWVSRHGDGRRAFEEAYGPELRLLAYTVEAVQRLQERSIDHIPRENGEGAILSGDD